MRERLARVGTSEGRFTRDGESGAEGGDGRGLDGEKGVFPAVVRGLRIWQIEILIVTVKNGFFRENGRAIQSANLLTQIRSL
jgi:hypothetical protein